MDGEKDVLAEEYRKSPAFASYHVFAPAGYVERYMKDAIFRFFEAKGENLIMTLQIYLETLSIYTHLNMEMEEFVA